MDRGGHQTPRIRSGSNQSHGGVCNQRISTTVDPLVVLLHRPITAQVNERAIVTHPTGHNALIGKGEGDSMTPITLDPWLIDWRG